MTTIADTAAGYAAYTLMPEGARDVAVRIAWYYANLDEPGRALALLQGVASAETDDASLEQRIAEVYARLGDADQARAHAQRAIALGLSPRMVMTPWLVKTLGTIGS